MKEEDPLRWLSRDMGAVEKEISIRERTVGKLTRIFQDLSSSVPALCLLHFLFPNVYISCYYPIPSHPLCWVLWGWHVLIILVSSSWTAMCPIWLWWWESHANQKSWALNSIGWLYGAIWWPKFGGDVSCVGERVRQSLDYQMASIRALLDI